jgi:hypothetical protein
MATTYVQIVNALHLALDRILTAPSLADLWHLQSVLLALGGDHSLQVREVAGEFHSYLRDLESKVASRRASRWGAFLETASVTSVSLQEMLVEEEDPLRRILNSGVTAALELAAAAKNVQAWEMEASLVHPDVAWYLYGELWDISAMAQPELPWQERQELLNRLTGPALSDEVPGEAKAALLVKLFQVVLAARTLPLLLGRRFS